MKTRSLAPGAYLARSGQGVSLYDADGKCFAMNKMGGSILALALTKRYSFQMMDIAEQILTVRILKR